MHHLRLSIALDNFFLVFAIASLLATFDHAGQVRGPSAGSSLRLVISRRSFHPLNAISIKGVALGNNKREYKKVLIQYDLQRGLRVGKHPWNSTLMLLVRFHLLSLSSTSHSPFTRVSTLSPGT